MAFKPEQLPLLRKAKLKYREMKPEMDEAQYWEILDLEFEDFTAEMASDILTFALRIECTMRPTSYLQERCLEIAESSVAPEEVRCSAAMCVGYVEEWYGIDKRQETIARLQQLEGIPKVGDGARSALEMIIGIQD